MNVKSVCASFTTALCGLSLCAFSVMGAEPALEFKRDWSRVAMPVDLYPSLSNLTLSVWIKTTVVPGANQFGSIAGRGYLGNYTGFGLFTHNNGNICFQTRKGGVNVQANTAYPFDAAWHHVTGVREGNVTRIYLDGKFMADATGVLGTLYQSDMAFALGMRHGVGTVWQYPYNGLMADVQLWDHARTGGQIREDMFRRLAGNEPGLIGYWPLNDPLGAPAAQDVAAGNDGALVNAFWTSDIFCDTHLSDSPNYLGYWAFELSDQDTGDTRVTVSNRVDITDFPVPDGYDRYQLAQSGDPAELDPEGWISTNTAPVEVSFADTPGRAAVYAWFTNTTESVPLRRSAARIIYLPKEAALDFSPRLPHSVQMTSNLFAGLNSLTLSAWIKTKVLPAEGSYGALAGRGYLLGTVNGFGLLLKPDGLVTFQTRTGGTVVQAEWPYPFDGAWHHVAGVRDDDSNATRLYLDGERVAEATGALTSLYSPDRIFALGACDRGSWGLYYDGQMADVRLWDYAQSDEEIRTGMFECLSGAESGLAGYWPLSEGNGEAVFDRTDLGNDGVCVNTPAWAADGEGVAALLPASRRPGLAGHWPMTLADPLTGNTLLSGTQEVSLTVFPVPPGYDGYQITVSPEVAAIEPGAWASTNIAPVLPALPAPAEGGRACYYAWFTNTAEAVSLRRSGGSITYAPKRPALDLSSGRRFRV